MPLAFFPSRPGFQGQISPYGLINREKISVSTAVAGSAPPFSDKTLGLFYNLVEFFIFIACVLEYTVLGVNLM